jgi:hypothetical protein
VSVYVLAREALHGHDGYVLLAAVVQRAGELATTLFHLIHSLDYLLNKFLVVKATTGSTQEGMQLIYKFSKEFNLLVT